MYVIYKFENIINGKIYIGFSGNIKKRLATYQRISTGNVYPSQKLRFFEYALIKYGLTNFKFTILNESTDKEYVLNILEPYYINLYNSLSTSNGYNISAGGSGINDYRHSESTKKIIGNKSKNKIWINNTIEEKMISKIESLPDGYQIGRLSNKNRKNLLGFKKGNAMPASFGYQISQRLTGKKQNPERAKKISIKMMGNKYTKDKKWYNNGIINKKYSDNDIIPEGFVAGMGSWIKEKISKTKKVNYEQKQRVN
jgi:group I intron endonuclease